MCVCVCVCVCVCHFIDEDIREKSLQPWNIVYNDFVPLMFKLPSVSVGAPELDG